MAGDAMPSITIVKSFTYRGSSELFSNTYHFDGDAPTTDTRWKALADAIINSERSIYPLDVTVVLAIGHEALNPVAVWSYDYLFHSATVPGNLSIGTAPRNAGDSAVWVRWSTTQLTSRGKPIYLRSYFHPGFGSANTAAGSDLILVSQKANLGTFGTAWVTGFSDGAVTHHRAGPRGAIAQTASPADYITTRTLERRGRRP